MGESKKVEKTDALAKILNTRQAKKSNVVSGSVPGPVGIQAEKLDIYRQLVEREEQMSVNFKKRKLNFF